MEKLFSMEEVKEAMFSMNKDKALGLHDFSINLYHVAWDVLKDNLMKVFAEFMKEDHEYRNDINFYCSYS